MRPGTVVENRHAHLDGGPGGDPGALAQVVRYSRPKLVLLIRAVTLRPDFPSMRPAALIIRRSPVKGASN